ncbi:hypothetical protein [Streptomyces yerevanensis]|uniref:hypothetical protein n=1 Tax=Streptomyces yerevanensis TaxID=66378 RepID=UPI000524AF48|nr:hypothetical protein [Streptomyces yerevanensis]
MAAGATNSTARTSSGRRPATYGSSRTLSSTVANHPAHAGNCPPLAARAAGLLGYMAVNMGD